MPEYAYVIPKCSAETAFAPPSAVPEYASVTHKTCNSFCPIISSVLNTPLLPCVENIEIASAPAPPSVVPEHPNVFSKYARSYH